MDDPIIDAQIKRLREGSLRHWGTQIERRGVGAAWPALVNESGDPVTALRHQAQAVHGAYLGDRIDPASGKPAGPAIYHSSLSKLIVGAPGVGKTTRTIIPGALQDLAAGVNVVLVTPQPKTVDDIYRAAREVSEAGEVKILDFGGRIVTQQSTKLTTWDPTRLSTDPEAARAFAATLAGPGSPAAKDLGQGRGAGFWMQIPEGVISAAAHLTAVERQVKEAGLLAQGCTPEQARAMSLNANGRSGINRVFEYLRSSPPNPELVGTPFEGLRKDLSPVPSAAQREALRDYPGKLRELEEIYQHAAYHAHQFPPMLQKLAFNRALLELQGAPVDRELAGAQLEDLRPIVENVSARESDPLPQLERSIKQAIPPAEQRILSPRPEDIEISPEQVVQGPGGLVVVSYDSTGSPGLAAGWFAKQVIKAAFDESSATQAEQLMGGDQRFGGVATWIDEGGALKYVDAVDQALTEGRQHGISVNISATSVAHLRDEVGPERADKIVHSTPITISMSPTREEAVALSDGFGTVKETQLSKTEQSFGALTTWQSSEREVPVMPVGQILNLTGGQAVVTDTSEPEHRVSLVKTVPFYQPGNPVGDVMAYLDEQDRPGMPWDELRPDVRARLDRRSDATTGLGELSEPEERGALRRMPTATVPPPPSPAAAEQVPPVQPGDLGQPSEQTAPRAAAPADVPRPPQPQDPGEL